MQSDTFSFPQISLIATETKYILISIIYRDKDFLSPSCACCQHKSRLSSPPLHTTIFIAECQAWGIPENCKVQTKSPLKPQSQRWVATILQPGCHLPCLLHGVGGFRFLFSSFPKICASNSASVSLLGLCVGQPQMVALLVTAE